ncbi:MAG: dihydroorotate dehydrogenase [Verrucomicrobiota bacterium]|jgi:dihydroorotate dehydrogenase
MTAETVYRNLLRPLLFLLNPETAHDLSIRMLRSASKTDALLRILEKVRPPPRPTTLLGLTFPNPIGLAAGFDKNGVALPAWAALGFGFIEIGTVTARAQPGNPKPRIFRFAKEQALINRLGFNNDGADVVANRLRWWQENGRWPKIPIGINIGKSKTTPIDEAPADYLHSFRRLRRFADYVVLNISSPNTPGLRSLQERKALSVLLRAIAEENRSNKPVLIKIAPDLAVDELDEMLATCAEHNVSGIIATNTTIDHSAVASDRDEVGGLSGAPLLSKSTAFVREITARSSLPVIASGGIVDAESAKEKIAAGAKLLQVYTGYVFRGPTLLREIAEAL